MKKRKKILIISLTSFLGLIVILMITFYGLFFNEVNAYMSFDKIDDDIYTMTYKNDYYFDEYLKTGTKTDEELASFIQKKVLHGLPIDFEIPDYSCSSFTSTNNDGDNCLCRNLDFKYSPILVLKTKPKRAYESISFVDLNLLGFSFDELPKKMSDKILCLASPYLAADGMNEMGVSINVNMVNGYRTYQETGKPGICTSTLVRLVLDYAKDVNDAIELIKKYDVTSSTGGPYHFQIADQSGDSAVIEFFNNEMQVIRSDKQYQAMTNHDLSGLEIVPSYHTRTFERMEILNETLSKTNGVLTEKEDFDLLMAVKMHWDKEELTFTTTDGRTVTSVTPERGTLYSVIYNLDKKSIKFIYKCNLDKVYELKIE